MDEKGDIPGEDEVRPSGVPTDTTVGIVNEILAKGGSVHAYFANHAEGSGDDIHLNKYDTYVWKHKRDGKGLIYTQVGDTDRWLFPEHIVYLERHYE